MTCLKFGWNEVLGVEVVQGFTAEDEVFLVWLALDEEEISPLRLHFKIPKAESRRISASDGNELKSRSEDAGNFGNMISVHDILHIWGLAQ